MHPDDRLKLAVKSFYAYIGAVAFAAVGPIGAASIVDNSDASWRIAGVILGVAAWIPLIVLIAWIIRAGDEFIRRIHLVTLSISFAIGLIIISLIDWLQRADFVRDVPLAVVWVTIAGVWVVTLFSVKHYYERPR